MSQQTNGRRWIRACVELAILLALSVPAIAGPAGASSAQTQQNTTAASGMTRSIPAAPTPADMLQSHTWAKPFFSRPADLPISFVLDEKAIHGIPQAWHPEASRRRIDNNRSETVFEGTDPKTGLHVRVEYTEYQDYPVVEWVAWFRNEGHQATPILRDILALDSTFQGTAPRLYSNNGDFYSEKGYTPAERTLEKGASVNFAPTGGRPSDGAFPYYRIMFDKWGLSLAIGWPAEWAAQFDGTAEGVHVRAGQQKTHLRLEPGENIRTPRITVLCWSGNAARAANLWRRWYLAHILPRPNGHPLKPLLAVAATDEGEEFTRATEENQLRYMAKFHRLGFNFDIWWIDAGWYPCAGHWPDTGTWEPDPARFPQGFKPVSDLATQYGAGLLVWFEPERVRRGTELDRDHPEWLFRLKDNENSLLNLGNPECRAWLTERVCRLIREGGIKVYRQDFNFEPLQYWRQNDAEDRQGMNENLHVQGYLQYWDDLLERNPGLWIDSCSSGGRRNDLETMRRSVPLHYSDYGYGYHAIKLSFHQTLFEWLPYFKDVTLSWDKVEPGRFDEQVDSYSYHCAMAPMLALGLDIKRDDYDFAASQKMIALWRRAADLILYGDYYPHTPFHRTPDQWVAWQFDSPEKGQGFLQAIRLPSAPDGTLTVHPKPIDPSARYIFENGESDETKTISGKELLASGFIFRQPPRSGAIWFYRRQEK